MDRGMSKNEVDTVGEPSRSAVEDDISGIESVCFGRASLDSALSSGRLVRDGPFVATVADSLPEVITDPEPPSCDPPDCDALGSVASGVSMSLVLMELKVSGVTLLGFADSDTGTLVPSRSDDVAVGVSDCPGIVGVIETLVWRKSGIEIFGSGTTDSEGPAAMDFSGTDRVEESESESSGLGMIEVDGLEGFVCPEGGTGTGKTRPPEVVMVGLAVTISDERGPSGSFDFVAEVDAISPSETESPFPDGTTLVPPAVLVVRCTGVVIGAVPPVINEPPDPNRCSLDRLTALVSSAMPASTDALACVDIGPDSESSELDRCVSIVREARTPGGAVGPGVTKSSEPGRSISGRSGRSGRLPVFASSGKMPAAEPLTPREIEAERSGSRLGAAKPAVFSGAILESATVVRTSTDSGTLNVECTKPDDSGIFVFRGKLSEAVMPAPLDLVAMSFRPPAADSLGMTREEIPEDERVGLEVEKTIVFAPNKAKLISVALSSIPASCAALSFSSALMADELFGRAVSVDDVVRI